MAFRPKLVLDLMKESYAEWSDDKASRLGAALAYYTIFSIAPLLIIVIAVVSFFWDNQSGAVQQEVVFQVRTLIGDEGATLVETMLDNSSRPGSGNILATVLGLVALLFGATGVFVQLQDALNTIWDVRTAPGRGLASFLSSRLISFGMILVVGFLLLVSLVISAVISAIGASFSEIINLLVSFLVIWLLFASIYRILPDVEIRWRDVGVGAFITAALFVIGKWGLGLYLGRSSAASTYGAAGSLVILLLWIYYSAQIFFFGAEFTQVYARRYGSRILPSPHAVSVAPSGQADCPDPEPPPAALPAPSGKSFRLLPLFLAFLVGRWLGRKTS